MLGVVDVVLGGTGVAPIGQCHCSQSQLHLQSLAVCGRRPRAQLLQSPRRGIGPAEEVTWTGLCVSTDGVMIAGPKKRILARGVRSFDPVMCYYLIWYCLFMQNEKNIFYVNSGYELISPILYLFLYFCSDSYSNTDNVSYICQIGYDSISTL